MPLQKQPVNINFVKGLDTKTDPYQVPIGNFLALTNSVFDTTGRLTKRNGFPIVTNLPNTQQTTLTTLSDNLLATGSNLYAFSADTNQWLNKGSIQPISLSTISVVRNSNNQVSPDLAIASNGLACSTFVSNGVATYQIFDSSTGQQITSVSLGASARSPRVFTLGTYFVVTFMTTISAVVHLQFVAIPITAPTSPLAATDIATSLTAVTDPYDGFIANNNLYVAYKAPGSNINLTRISSILTVFSPVIIAAAPATLISVTADTTQSTAVVWVTYYNSGTTKTTAYSSLLNPVPLLPPTVLYAGITTVRISTIAANMSMTLYYEVSNTYAYSPNAISDFVNKISVTQAGAVGSPSTVVRSVALASKPFTKAGITYMLVAYGDTVQTGASATNEPTYFLIDDSGNVYMRLANNNGGGYPSSWVLPTVNLFNTSYFVPYLISDSLVAVNKGVNLPAGTPVNQILTQTGVNMAVFSLNTSGQFSSEIAGSLHLTGGILWQFDGVKPVEHGFNLYPENVAVTTIASGGSISAQTYFYSFTYEWTDNAGNLHRSAPSIPTKIVVSSGSSTNTVNVPTLRLTYKVGTNPVRIVGYRWSTAQQTLYQFTSYSSPVINDTTIDSVTITDTQSDAAILGNTILYTTGGVIEDIAAPSFVHTAMFKNRLFGIDSEDQNLLWFSKQVIENVPVEMSDLLTEFVSPTTGTQGSTGPMTALSAMDDKLIIFKNSAIYYITGDGPDNTGSSAGASFSDPIYVTSSVGCSNPASIVLTPSGIMFQSDHGIWLLGRDLSTTYVGAPVEAFNGNTITSANRIPGTNQVRFVLNNSFMLMYDYFRDQWGQFTSQNAISATVWQNKHTYLSSLGSVYQEKSNTYLDGTAPVLLSFTTSWINIAGLQGFERFYYMFLLGTYFTPFKLAVQIGYDYNSSFTQSTVVTPENALNDFWGGDALWGSGDTWGGPTNVFEAQVFPQLQKCSAFQLTVQETYDSSMGVPAGAGLTLSGINMVIGVKKGARTQKASRQFG